MDDSGLIGDVGLISIGAGEDDGVLDSEIREAAYREELAEIARLREALWPRHKTLAGCPLTDAARRRGREILAYRVAVAEAIYYGKPLPEFKPFEPIEREPRPKARPKAKRKVGPRWPAKAAGLKFYIPDRPCKRGHSRRLTSTGACPECERVRK